MLLLDGISSARRIAAMRPEIQNLCRRAAGRDGSGKGSFAVAVLELCRGAYWSNWWRFAPVSALWTPGVSVP